MKIRKSLSLAGVLAAGVSAVAIATAPAASATPVGVDVNCVSGSSQIGCQVTWRTTDDRVAIRWEVNGRHLASADDQDSFRLDCIPGDYYSVTAVVADSTGRASDSARVMCVRG